MDIVFAADDNYAAYLCVAAKSVEAAHPDTEIRFHVLDAGISEENRAAVAANLRGGGNIRFIDVNPEDFAGFPLKHQAHFHYDLCPPEIGRIHCRLRQSPVSGYGRIGQGRPEALMGYRFGR